MSSKTSKQIQGDIRDLFMESYLYMELSGSVYRNGLRPRDSRLEDAVIVFTDGLPDQVQTGTVTIQIYVPDIDPYGNGVLVEDGARLEEIEGYAQQWVDSLTADRSCYLFSLERTIMTDVAEEISQHFVVIRLNYKYFD